jgi:deazaflavin-dependent oxidoreductase (nitroreductase family)
MAGDFQMKAMNKVHGGLLRISGGRLGWRLYGMPVVELTTKGRRSGLPRTSLLTSPVQDGDAFVIVASRGGDDVHPAWFLNLQSDPEVMVRSGRAPARPMRARVAEGAERDELWKRIMAYKPHYGGYQDKTERVIPLVVLEPR